MNSSLCPAPQINYTFTDSELYTISIDYTNIFYNYSVGEWQIKDVENCENVEYSYNLFYPEPPQSLFDTVIDTIKGWICTIFPFFGFCS